jgi:hypothetical protein
MRGLLDADATNYRINHPAARAFLNQNHMKEDIATEIANKFYRPAVSSVHLYWLKKRSAILAKWSRSIRFWSLLAAMTSPFRLPNYEPKPYACSHLTPLAIFDIVERARSTRKADGGER